MAGKEPFINRRDAEDVVNKLADLGYYKYADPEDVYSLYEDLVDAIEMYGTLSTIYFDITLSPKDYRYYMFDNEDVFEGDGFTDAIENMKGIFDKIGLKLEITNHIEDWDSVDHAVNHEITINNKRYIIFENFTGYGWGEAAQKFAEVINDQLLLQNKDERLYLINAGNEGEAIFLTDAQFDLLDLLLTDDKCKPLKIDKWCKVFEVDPL